MMDDKKKVELNDEELDNVTGGTGVDMTPNQMADMQLGIDDFQDPASYQGE